MTKLFRDNKGSALATVMMVAGIGTVVVLAMVSFFSQSMGFQRQLQSRVEVSGLQQAIISTLADSKRCSAAVSGQSIKNSQNSFVFNDPLLGEIKNGYKVDQAEVNSVKLVDVTPLDPNFFAANMEISFKVPKNAIAMKPKKFPLYLVAESGVLKGCSASYSHQEMCEDWGGIYVTSPSGSRCQLPVNQNIVGSCGNGQVLVGIESSGKKICRSLASIIAEDPSVIPSGPSNPPSGGGKTYNVEFKNGFAPSGKVIGAVSLPEGGSQLVTVGSPAGRHTKVRVSVQSGNLKVQPEDGYYPQLCYQHNGHVPCQSGYGSSGNDFNCGLPIHWEGDFTGNLSPKVNCGYW